MPKAIRDMADRNKVLVSGGSGGSSGGGSGGGGIPLHVCLPGSCCIAACYLPDWLLLAGR